MTRGKLIVFEGLDRAGKSTQVKLLAEALEKDGVTVQQMRFPDRITPIGQMINSYLSGESEQEDHVIHLLFSANRWEASSKIRNLIDSGTTIIIDRYYYSGIVYSAAKQNPTLSLQYARQPDVGLPRPDLVVFLDLDAEEQRKRGGFGGERYEKEELQKRVRELFYEVMGRGEGEDFVKVDAGGSVDEVAGEVGRVVRQCVDKIEAEDTPLRSVGEW